MEDPRPRSTSLTLTVGVDSTETDAASEVEDAARSAVAEALHVVDVDLALVDFAGRPWSPLATD